MRGAKRHICFTDSDFQYPLPPMAFRSWTLTCRTSIQVRPPPCNDQSAFLIYKSFQSKKKRRDEINHLAVLYFYFFFSALTIATRSSSNCSHSVSRFTIICLYSLLNSLMSKFINSCSRIICSKRSSTLKVIL